MTQNDFLMFYGLKIKYKYPPHSHSQANLPPLISKHHARATRRALPLGTTAKLPPRGCQAQRASLPRRGQQAEAPAPAGAESKRPEPAGNPAGGGSAA